MEVNKKEVQIHLVPTETGNMCQVIDLDRSSNKLETVYCIQTNRDAFKQEKGNGFHINPFHLYFTSDEEIKSGKEVYYIDKFTGKVISSGGAEYGSKQQVIIASTDPKLTIETSATGVTDCGRSRTFYSKKRIAQPTQAFIEYYCEQGGIDKVLVEYEFDIKKRNEDEVTKGYSNVKSTLKVDPIHNTITTHRIVEKTYTKEEVEKLTHSAYMRGYEKGCNHPNIKGYSNWKEQNL